MTIDDIKELAEIMQHKGNVPDSKRRINRIVGNKSCTTILRELKILMQRLPGKEANKALLLVVLSLLYKNTGLFADLQKALDREMLIPNLYGAFCVFLGGKSQTMCLKVDLAESGFPNRYSYLTRFAGEFGYWENLEIFYAVKILAVSDRAKFEEVAFKDATRLILLNMISLHMEEYPSDALITRLLKDGDELQANIGFYFAVRSITRDVRDYEQLRRNPDLPGNKSKRQIDKNIMAHLETFHGFFECCSRERKASLLVNYILSEKEYPVQFGYWLMAAELQEALIYEITASGKVKNLEGLVKIANLIHGFPCKAENGVRGKKDKLYEAVLVILKKFVSERQGIYSWDGRQESLFCGISRTLPQRYRQQLSTYLKRVERDLMVSRLDEMVRFSIYLKDKRQWDICQGMRKMLAEAGG